MTGTGIFPKIDGDIFYGQDANLCYFGRYGATMTYGTITINNTSTLIKTSNSNRIVILLYNNSANDIYVGVTGVTTSSGYKLASGDTFIMSDNDAVYGVSSAGSDNLRYMEVAI